MIDQVTVTMSKEALDALLINFLRFATIESPLRDEVDHALRTAKPAADLDAANARIAALEAQVAEMQGVVEAVGKLDAAMRGRIDFVKIGEHSDKTMMVWNEIDDVLIKTDTLAAALIALAAA